MRIIKKLSSFFEKTSRVLSLYARFPVILFLSLIVFIFSFFVMPSLERMIQKEGAQGFIDSFFFPTPDCSYAVAQILSHEVRIRYLISSLTLDLIYPLSYSLLGSLLITFLIQKSKSERFIKLNLIPFMALFFDFLENIGIALTLLIYPSKSRGIGLLTMFANGMKWISVGAIGFLILFFLICFVSRKRTDRTQNI